MTIPSIEQWAADEHLCWSNWMKYMFSKGQFQSDGTWTMPEWAVERWTRQMNTPYSLLDEKEKQSDRDVVKEYHGHHWEGIKVTE